MLRQICFATDKLNLGNVCELTILILKAIVSTIVVWDFKNSKTELPDLSNYVQMQPRMQK